MEIKLLKVEMKNYKSHQDLTVNFGEVTKITGDNAQGKSTILETPTFTLYNSNIWGSKLDPTPITNDMQAGETLVQALFEVDGKQLLLGRGLKSGKAKYYINEVPSKAKEFDEVVKQLFDKELFFSLYNPSYFFKIHWEKQRSMLLQYVSAPTNKQVFNEMSRKGKEKVADIVLNPQAEKLSELIKKHSLDDLQKIHRENKTKKEKAHIAAQSRTKTLQEQLDQLQLSDVSIEKVKKELDDIADQIGEIEKNIAGANVLNQQYNSKKSELGNIRHQIEMNKDRWPSLRDEVIEDTCRTCKQPLNEDSVKAVEADKENRVAHFKSSHSELLKQRDQLMEELTKIEFVDVTEQTEKSRELYAKRQPLLEVVRAHKQHEQLLTQVEQAKTDEQDKLKSLNDSIFILDSIKAFRAKEAELQGEKVQKLFETLSVRLFDEQKNGEIKPTFEIEYEGRPYSKLSLSESIRAGLELREVLSEQSGIIAPCMVDNAESITSFKEPTGQLIMSRVVADQELKIEVSNNE
jgi:DNA repair exonuclease SbcCD ATPase subunit